MDGLEQLVAESKVSFVEKQHLVVLQHNIMATCRFTTATRTAAPGSMGVMQLLLAANLAHCDRNRQGCADNTALQLRAAKCCLAGP